MTFTSMFTAENSLIRTSNNYAGIAADPAGASGIAPASGCGKVCPDGTSCSCSAPDTRSRGSSRDQPKVSCPAGSQCVCECDGEVGNMAHCWCL